MDEAEQSGPLCAVCYKEIPAGARKCFVCGEYQSWWRRLLSGIDIKALIALVPILTLAYAFLQTHLTTHESLLRATIMACERAKIALFVSNLGDRGAIIRSATYSVTENNQTSERIPLEIRRKPDSSALVPSGETQLIELVSSAIGNLPVNFPRAGANAGSCRIDLAISVVAFDHDASDLELTCPCPS
ncbi:MAG: hypothetical protein ACFCUQ_15560 [Kiloniellales bacterium]